MMCVCTESILSLLLIHLCIRRGFKPNNDGQAAGYSFISKVGLGRPTEIRENTPVDPLKDLE